MYRIHDSSQLILLYLGKFSVLTKARRTYIRRLLYLPLILTVILASAADLRFRHLTIDDGLPSNYCLAVMQDSRGFIWITTRGGISRYDGYELKVFQYDPNDSTSISEIGIAHHQGIAEDDQGNVWVATDRGICKYDYNTDSFTRYLYAWNEYDSISSEKIHCVLSDKEGKVWVGTSGSHSLKLYDENSDRFIDFTGGSADRILKNQNVRCLWQDKTGRLWIGTTSTLFYYEKSSRTLKKIPFSPSLAGFSSKIRFKIIREDANGQLYFGTQYGFIQFDTLRQELIPVRHLFDPKQDNRFVDILQDTTNPEFTHWVIYNFSVIRYNMNTGEKMIIKPDNKVLTGLTGTVPRSIYRDNSGTLWIPGQYGVNILSPLLNQITIHDDFGKEYGNGELFLKDTKSNLWISFSEKELICFDRNFDPIKRYLIPQNEASSRVGNSIWSLMEDSRENLWVGFDFTGLHLLDRKLGKLVPCNLTPDNPPFIYEVFEDSRGMIWVAAGWDGLYRRKENDTSLLSFQLDTSFKKMCRGILTVNEDRDGNIWIGSAGDGLFMQPANNRDTNHFIQFKHAAGDSTSLSGNWVWNIFVDDQNDIWLATNFGLCKYRIEDNIFIRYINPESPAMNYIYDLTSDNQGNIWFTSEGGLIRMQPGKTGADAYKKYIPSGEIFIYELYKDSEGTIYVPASEASADMGFFSFKPEILKENRRIPPIVLTEFQISNQPFDLDSNIILKEHIILSYDQNFFSFEYAALDFTEPEKNKYACYLEGYDQQWIQKGNERKAHYTGVPPGDYLFHVKGTNNDGVWNETGRQVAVTILPPPWLTWWAFTAYGLVTLLFLYLIIRFYLNRLQLAHRLEMEHMEAEKLKELDSLKSRFFANISHEFRTPLTLILGPLDNIQDQVSIGVRKEIAVIRKNAIRLQRLIEQLLSLSALDAGKLELQTRKTNIVVRVREYMQSFESLARQKQIALDFFSEEKELYLYVDLEKIEKIFYNLLSNAFKFTTEGGVVKVMISREKSSSVSANQSEISKNAHAIENETGYICISVMDSGAGIEAKHLLHIFDRFYRVGNDGNALQEGSGIGLALTRELVNLHRGTLSVSSEPGVGTTFTVKLPAGKKHLSPGEILDDKVLKTEEKVLVLDRVVEENNDMPVINPFDEEEEEPLAVVVEDNSDLRRYISGRLEGIFNVVEARNGKEALEIALEHVPDILVSDVMMPEMDGFALCEKLKADERTSHIPIILLTARADQASRIRGLETGADDFICKPFDAQELIVRMNNLVAQREKLKTFYKKEIELSKQGEVREILSMDQKFIRKAIAVVEENLSATDFNTKTFAKQMNLSRTQLHRKLKALVDKPATGFIRTIRLNKAAKLIAANSDTVSQIAYEVGFNSLPYFTKCFREQFGVNPSEFTAKRKE